MFLSSNSPIDMNSNGMLKFKKKTIVKPRKKTVQLIFLSHRLFDVEQPLNTIITGDWLSSASVVSSKQSMDLGKYTYCVPNSARILRPNLVSEEMNLVILYVPTGRSLKLTNCLAAQDSFNNCKADMLENFLETNLKQDWIKIRAWFEFLYNSIGRTSNMSAFNPLSQHDRCNALTKIYPNSEHLVWHIKHTEKGLLIWWIPGMC